MAVDSLIEAYKQGDPINDIAYRFGIHRATVLSYVSKRGLEPRAGKIDRQLDKAVALYRDGNSLAQVGRLLGAHPETIRQAFIRNGVPIRSRRGWPS